MQTSPVDVADEQVLSLARDGWDPDLRAVEHLPVGFGAHHWRADTPHGPALFLTLDVANPHHTAATLEGAYAAAAALAEDGLDFVHPCVRSGSGAFTVPLGSGWLSATRWVDGTRPLGPPPDVLHRIARLHDSRPPAGVGVGRWEPLVTSDLVDQLSAWVSSPWNEGPFGELARSEVSANGVRIDAWLATYLSLADQADPDTFVLTHGEPGLHNQWLASDGRWLLLDWESLLLAPRERDLRSLEGVPPDLVDTRMTELLDLEWRLSEIRDFADWLRGPHTGSKDDLMAFEGLRDELTRPSWAVEPHRSMDRQDSRRVSVFEQVGARKVVENPCPHVGHEGLFRGSVVGGP